MIRYILSTIILAAVSVSCWALEVSHLTVNTLPNPQGIDDSHPKFGWNIIADERGVMQTSYELQIYSDAERQQQVWSSGSIETDASQNVEPDGLTLQPHSRYWWDVSVTDNFGRTATSTEAAYFDTGVMGDWGTAQWIKGSDYPYGIYMPGKKITDYSIDADIEIQQIAASICYSKGNDDSMMMWRIDLSRDDRPEFQPYLWVHGDTVRLDTIDIRHCGVQLYQPLHLRIEVSGGGTVSHTYINGQMVYEHHGEYLYSQIGIKEFATDGGPAESAYYDNVRVAELSTDRDLFFDDFTTGSHFMSGEVRDGRLLVTGNERLRSFCWQIAGYIGSEIDADITIVSGAPGLVFGWTAGKAYFHWQILTDGGRTEPVLRQSILTHSDEVWQREVPLRGYRCDDFIGKEHRLHLSIYNVKIITSIDSVAVDTMTSFRRVPVGQIGMSAAAGDEGYFDNLTVRLKYPNGRLTGYFSEDFEAGQSAYYMDATIADIGGSKKCHVTPLPDNGLMMQTRNKVTAYTTEFVLDKPIMSATLYSTALGVYDAWINGSRVGHPMPDGSTEYEEMKPGWTDYRYRVQYSTHDVTALCHQGVNSIGAIVTDGWLKGEIAKSTYPDIESGLLCKLIVTYTDGTQKEIGTDQKWRSTKNVPLYNGEIYHGENYNAMVSYPWEADAAPYLNTVEAYSYQGAVVPQAGPYVKVLTDYVFEPSPTVVYAGTQPGTDYGMINVVAEYTMPTAIALEPGQTVIYDFRQNHSGIPRITVRGRRGTRMHVRFAEMLNDTGEEARGNDGPGGSLYRANYRWAHSELYYTLSGKDAGETYQSSTVFYGYRYIEVTASDAIEITEIASLSISSSHIDAGTIQTDDGLVNRLISNAQWGQRSNLLSVPTDCPQRDERLGWAGDTQVFCNTAMYNANTTAFYAKWLTDMRDAQRDDGAYSDIAPLSLKYWGNAGWADAGIIVTWNAYLMSGDRAVICDNYEAMRRYMSWLSVQMVKGIYYPGGGTTYGDWLGYVHTDKRYISEAYFAYDAKLMAKMSRVLSESRGDEYDREAQRYEELFRAIVDEMQELYFSENSDMEHTQTSYILALQFGLYTDPEQKLQIAERLSRLIEANGYKLDTGFIGTAYINTALSIGRHDDIAYCLLQQRENPSWLYSIDQGATTMWERWDSYTKERGFGDASMNSFNHYAYGAICEWMYRDMAGISTSEEAPGFKKTIFAPKFDMRERLPEGQQRIRSVAATYQSAHGMIQSDWSIDDGDSYSYHIIVPANTTAEVHLPVADEAVEIMVSDIFATYSDDVEYLGYEDGIKKFAIGSGEYTFFNIGFNIGRPGCWVTESSIKIYPNPVRDLLYINSPEPIKNISFISKLGQVERDFGGGTNIIDTSALRPELYIMRVETESHTECFKVIKQR